MIQAISTLSQSSPFYVTRAKQQPPAAYANSPVQGFSRDTYTSEKPVYDPALPPRGHFWDRSDVRVGAMMAASATVGGGLGGWIASSAGRSVGGGVALGATLGMALPLALVYWGLSQWDGH